MSNSLAASLDAVVHHVLALAENAGVRPGTSWSLGEVGVYGNFPWDSYREAARQSNDALRRLASGDLPMVGGQPIPWGSQSLRSRAKLGTLFLLGATWAAREDQFEGTVWRHVRDSPAMASFIEGGLESTMLFQSDPGRPNRAVPTRLTRELIRSAVEGLGVRNALDCEDVHRWVLTLNLQFGIPVKGFVTAGSDWLRGAGRPQAVEYLLGEKPLNGRDLTSASFKRTWRSLREFMRGRQGQAATKSELEQNRWASGNDWFAEIRKAAIQVDFADGTNQHERVPLSRSNPHLTIDADGTAWWLVGLSIPDADSRSVSADELVLRVNGRKLGSIRRHPESEDEDEGHWQGLHLSEVLTNAEIPRAWIRMPQRFGPWREIQATMTGTSEPVFVFPLSHEQREREQEPFLLEPMAEGLWRPCERPRQDQSYVLAIPPGLREAEASWPAVAGGIGMGAPDAPWSLRHLRASGHPLELHLRGEVLWRMDAADQRAAAVPPPRLRQETILIGGHEVSSVRVVSPSQATIEHAVDEETGVEIPILNGQLNIPQRHFESAGTTRSESHLRIRVAVGENRRTVRTVVHYPKPHLVIESESGPRRHPSAKPIYLNDASLIRLTGVGPRGNQAFRTPFVFEGNAPRFRASSLMTPSGRRGAVALLGAGEGIRIIDDLLNHAAAGTNKRLATTVINTGVFSPAEPAILSSIGEAQATQVDFTMVYPDIAPDASWSVELLMQDGQVHVSGSLRASESAGDWRLHASFDRTIDSEELIAARLIVGTRVRGRWERLDAMEVISDALNVETWWRTMLLWELQPPRRQSERWQQFVALAKSQPNAVLVSPQSPDSEGSPQTLVDLDDRHASLVEQVVECFTGSADEAPVLDSIAESLEALGTGVDRRFESICRRLIRAVRCSPLFAANLVRAMDADSGRDRPRRTAIIKALRSWDGAVRSLDWLIERAAAPESLLARLFPRNEARIDPGFIEESLRQARWAFAAGRMQDPAFANLRILWNMTRREGLIARIVASELIRDD